MKRIILHIDRLVLKGYQHEDRQGIAAGLQQELAKLFAVPQAAQQLTTMGDISRLRAGNIRVGPGEKSQHVGSQVAQGIAKGMKT